MVKCCLCYTFYYSCKKKNVLTGSNKYCFRTDLIHLKLYFLLPVNISYFFATVKKGITKTMLNKFIRPQALVNLTKELGIVLHSTQYTLAQYTVHSTQYTVHSAQYTVHSTQYTVRAAVGHFSNGNFQKKFL